MFAPATTAVLLMLHLPAPGEVPALVAKLAAPDFRTREAAGRMIVAGGEPLLPALRAERGRTTNVEAAERLDDLIAQLDAERLARPTCITFHVERAFSVKAIDAIVAQSGYAVRADCPEATLRLPVTVAWDGTPFWQALDDVCRQTGLTIHPADDGIVLKPTETFAPHVAYSGPFRFVATNVSSRRELPLAGLPRSVAPPRPPEQLGLTFQIQSEPKAPLVGLRPPRLAASTDRLLSPTDDANGVAVPFLFRSHSQMATLPFTRTDRSATVARRLAGKVSLVVLAECRAEVSIDLTAPVAKSGRSLTVSVSGVRRSSGDIALTLKAKPKTPPMDPYAWANALYQRLEVTDDRGQRWPAGAVAEQVIEPTGVTLTLTFAPPAGVTGGTPTSLQVMDWTTRTQSVEFAFGNLPLP